MQTPLREIAGVADRTLMRDNSWIFFRSGLFLERMLFTQQLIHRLFPSLYDEVGAHRWNDSDLVLLLRILTSLDSYHRHFRGRAFLDRLIHLIYSSGSAPNSVWYCLDELSEVLQRLKTTKGESLSAEIKRVEALKKELATIDWPHWFPFRQQPENAFPANPHLGRDCLKQIAHFHEETLAIHRQLDAVFFSHDL